MLLLHRAHRMMSLLRLPGMVFGCVLLAGCATAFSGYRQQNLPKLTDETTQPAQNDRGMYLQLIRQMQQQGAYYASLAHVEAFRKQYGDSPELRLLQADALRETGQPAAAGKLYEGLTTGTQVAAAWHGLGLIAARAGDRDRAEQALASAVQMDPVNVAYLSDLGYARLQAGNLDSAHEPLAKAAELAPSNTKGVSNLILWNLLQGRTAQAEAMMQKAQLQPASRTEILRLALELRRTPIAATTVTDPHPPTSTGTDSASTTSRMVGIPEAMLDRFDSNRVTKGARP